MVKKGGKTYSGTKICDICSYRMVLIEERMIGDTPYGMFRCEKCKRVVAKNLE